MKANLLKTRNGVTLLELVISAGLLSLVMVGTLMLLITMLSLWSKGASGTSANSHASLAMRKLVLQIEEGKSASVSSDHLTVVFPYYDTTTGNYDRTQTGVTATYYLSGANSTETSGDLTYLWKAVGSNKTLLSKNVKKDDSLPLFTVTNGNLVHINLTGWDQEGGAITPNLIQQSVRLRNS